MSENHADQTQVLEHDESSSTKKVLNYGWDSDNLQAVREAVDSDGNKIVKNIEVVPTDSTQTNPSLVLTRNDDGYVITIEMTIGTTTYTKTITRDSNNYIQSISSWSE